MALTMDTVASVNGLTVTTTQGYTLTRIGNKSLREGDTVYTDGKYVYGMEGSGGKQLPMLPSVNYYCAPRIWPNAIYGFSSPFTKPKIIAKSDYYYRKFLVSSGGCWVCNYNYEFKNILTGGTVSNIINRFSKEIDKMGIGFYHGSPYSDFLDENVDENGNLVHLIPFTYQKRSSSGYVTGGGFARLINGEINKIVVSNEGLDSYSSYGEFVYGNLYNGTDYQCIFKGYKGHDEFLTLFDSKDGVKQIGMAENFSCDLKIGIGLNSKPIIKHCSGNYYSGFLWSYGNGVISDCMGYESHGVNTVWSACQVDGDRYLFITEYGVSLFNKKTKQTRMLVGTNQFQELNPHIVKLPYDMKRKIKSALQNFKF